MNKEFSSDIVQLATRIPKSLHVRVRVTALDEGVTLADWVSDALEQHLERCGGRKRLRKATTTAKGSAPSTA